MTEVQRKIGILRAMMSSRDAVAIRLRGVDWFAWATGGGSSVVIFTTETGVADVLVTADRALILTNPIEKRRLSQEEIGSEFEILETPWADAAAQGELVKKITGGGLVLSDRPGVGEGPLPRELVVERLRMQPEERERYRALARASAEAMTEAMSAAEPGWTEERLAGEGARALWSRGIHPTLVLVAGAERLEMHRHPFPSRAPLGDRAMMVFCARKHGLYANLTRFITFRQPTTMEEERMRIVAEIENVAFTHSVRGNYLNLVYEELVAAYGKLGHPHEPLNQHFGGLTGYLSREAFARPLLSGEPAWPILEDSALAWNPTLPGSKIEDTVLVGATELEILTIDPKWPTVEFHGRKRPQVMVKR